MGLGLGLDGDGDGDGDGVGVGVDLGREGSERSWLQINPSRPSSADDGGEDKAVSTLWCCSC